MINSETKICCLLGDPVEHSLSPMMHNAAFSELGLNFVYVAFRVKGDRLEKAVDGIRAFQIRGANVTIPHKMEIMKFLDKIDDLALKIGAVNTIVNDNGILKGFNTDALGFSKVIEENKVKLKNKKILLFGAGGAARAITFQSALEGGKIVIANRTLEKAEKIKKKIKVELKKDVDIIDLTEKKMLKNELKETDVVINATSIGMLPKVNESIISRELLHPDLVVMDIVYTPIETKLVKEAKEIGCQKVIDGVEMLVQQGALSFEIWTGKKAPVEVMRKRWFLKKMKRK